MTAPHGAVLRVILKYVLTEIMNWLGSYCRLQEELERERSLSNTLEAKVKSLQQQLAELQQLHWQQQQLDK